MILLILVKQN